MTGTRRRFLPGREVLAMLACPAPGGRPGWRLEALAQALYLPVDDVEAAILGLVERGQVVCLGDGTWALGSSERGGSR